MIIRVAFVFLLLPTLARADAIIGVEGECPPGLSKAMVGHGEECVPDSCSSASDCERGSTCVSYCRCMAERRVLGHRQGPHDAIVPIGPCDASGACSDGEPSQRQQCEPTESTPAFDPANHRWTGQPHPSSSFCSATRAPSGWLVPGLVLLLARRRQSKNRRTFNASS